MEIGLLNRGSEKASQRRGLLSKDLKKVKERVTRMSGKSIAERTVNSKALRSYFRFSVTLFSCLQTGRIRPEDNIM